MDYIRKSVLLVFFLLFVAWLLTDLYALCYSDTKNGSSLELILSTSQHPFISTDLLLNPHISSRRLRVLLLWF
jgi:hypothetical protein